MAGDDSVSEVLSLVEVMTEPQVLRQPSLLLAGLLREIVSSDREIVQGAQCGDQFTLFGQGEQRNAVVGPGPEWALPTGGAGGGSA